MTRQQVLSLNAFLWLVLLAGCTPATLSPGAREIRVTSTKLQTETEMSVAGKHFTPNIRIDITIANFPKADGGIPFSGNTDSAGNFIAVKSFSRRSVDRNDEFINLLVTARDTTTGQFVVENTSAEPYVTRR
jgi:hypothetical protein